jgi:hypothetical protein
VAVLRQRIMSIDFSWEKTVDKYFSVYQRIGARIEKIQQSPEVHVESSPELPEPAPKKAVAKKLPASSEAPPKKAPGKPKATAGLQEKVKKKKP